MEYSNLLKLIKENFSVRHKATRDWLNNHTKILTITACALVLLYLMATIGIKYTYKKYQNDIIAKIEDAIGRKVTIEKQSSIRLSTLLNPKLKFENLNISNANWSKNQNMLFVENLDAELSLMKLFLGKILINKLEIKNPKLVLEKKLENQNNWSNFTKTEPNKKSNLLIDDIKISGGEIAYIDHSLNETQKFKFKTIEINNIYNQNVNLHINTKYNGETLKADANVNFSDTHFNLENLNLIYANNQLSGNFSLNTKTNKITSELKSKNLDLDKIKSLSKGEKTDTKLPLNFLKYRQVNIKTEINNLRFNKKDIKNLIITADQKNNDLLIQFSPIEIYNGIINAKITSDLDSFTHGINIDLKNINISSMLENKKLVKSGILDGYAKLSTSGDRTRALIKNLTGKVYFESKNGEINSKIGALDENILSAIITAAANDDSTLPYSCAIANFRVKNGVMNIKNSIAIETPVLNVTGNGAINLNNEKLNILLKASNKSSIKIDELSTSNLIKVVGTIYEPKLSIDPKGVIEKSATIGLSIFTGGTSSIAKQILDIAEDEDEHPCETAKKF